MKLRIVKPKRFALMVAVLILITCLCSYAACKPSYEVCEVTVCEGDSIWSIADAYTDESEDIRKVIHNIRELNGLEDAVVYPGDTLLIPLEVKDE